MATFAEAITEAARGVVCQILGANEKAWSFVQPVVGITPLGEAANNLYYRHCSPPEPTPPIPPPFAGGQCPVQYDVTYTYRDEIQTQVGGQFFPRQFSETLRGFGPVRGLAFEPGVGGRLGVRFANGIVPGNLISSPTPCEGSQPFGRNCEQFITNIVRVDGQPDVCGDPAPVVPPWPPGGDTFNTNITYETNNNLTLTVPLIFGVFAPFIAIDGTLNVPVNVNVNGELNLSGTIQLSPEFNFNFGVPLSPDIGVPDRPILPPGNPSTGVPDPPSGPDPTIIGVHVRVTDDPAPVTTVIFRDSGPDIIAPRAATVKFAVRTGGLVGWTEDIPVKNTQAYIPCPAPQGAVDVAVVGDRGLSVTFTPVRGRPLLPP